MRAKPADHVEQPLDEEGRSVATQQLGVHEAQDEEEAADLLPPTLSPVLSPASGAPLAADEIAEAIGAGAL